MPASCPPPCSCHNKENPHPNIKRIRRLTLHHNVSKKVTFANDDKKPKAKVEAKKQGKPKENIGKRILIMHRHFKILNKNTHL